MPAHIKFDDAWQQIPHSDRTTAKTVWHYTNATGLKGIIESTSLWATSTIALNDTREVEYGLDLVRGLWREMRVTEVQDAASRRLSDLLGDELASGTLALDIHVVSASTDDDSLNQWQGYAEAQGYAIGFAPNLRFAPFAMSDAIPDDPVPMLGAWYDVVYDPEVQRSMATESIEYALRFLRAPGPIEERGFHLPIILGTVIARLKHPAFAAEREVRMITADLGDDGFRVGPHGIVPFKTLMPADPNGHLVVTAPWSLLPIVGVRCGPTDSPSGALSARRGVERLLRAYGYGEAQVDSSSVPYRT